MKLCEFDFDLDEKLIATKPLDNRDNSRLLILNNGEIEDSIFSNLPDLLVDGDLLIFNNSKVIKSFIEINDCSFNLCLNLEGDKWLVMAKPAKKFAKIEEFELSNNLKFKVIENRGFGEFVIEFIYDGIFFDELNKIGKIPLPHYIRKFRKEDETDDINYQTIYAKAPGSMAAPTAGLHFTDQIFEKIKQKNVEIDYVTLHVGSGTFLPVKTEDINEHRMHQERFFVSQSTIEKIRNAKTNKRRVIAVGTTSVRVLESIGNRLFTEDQFDEMTEIFIKPGYDFKIIDCMITNFHLPQSTLIMLVSAFAGLQNIQNAYKHAIKSSYRFFSYGDAQFLYKEKC